MVITILDRLNLSKSVISAAAFALCGSQAISEEMKVAVFHPPQGFVETLEKIDREGKIITSRNGWFPPEEAKLWVIFYSSSNAGLALPRMANSVIDSIGETNSALTRANVSLSGGREITLQVNNLANTNKGANFQGCIAALDLASLAYTEAISSEELISDFCSQY